MYPINPLDYSKTQRAEWERTVEAWRLTRLLRPARRPDTTGETRIERSLSVPRPAH